MAQPVNVPYTITSKYGPRSAPTAGASTNHAGIDISVPRGTMVVSTEPGTVQTISSSSARGNYITVLFDSGYSATYQHLDSTIAKVGQRVAEGAALGLSGNTGISTGPHLHFEVKNSSGQLIDPEVYLKGLTSTNTSTKQQRINSYLGAGGIAAAPSNLPGVNNFIKQYWLFIVGALLVVGILRK